LGEGIFFGRWVRNLKMYPYGIHDHKIFVRFALGSPVAKLGFGSWDFFWPLGKESKNVEQ
jgi:hypothetical protein